MAGEKPRVQDEAPAPAQTSDSADVESMSAIARYVWHRGVLSVILVHAIYKALSRLKERAGTDGKIQQPVRPIPLSIWRVRFLWVRVEPVPDTSEMLELSLHPWRWLEVIAELLTRKPGILAVRLSALNNRDAGSRERAVAWRRVYLYL